MYISSLSLANFRNYTSEKIEFSPYTNVIYGDNAQGKTNILEAVYIFSQGRSHRAKSDKDCFIQGVHKIHIILYPTYINCHMLLYYILNI